MSVHEPYDLKLSKADAIVSLTVIFAALTFLLAELALEAWALMLLAGALYSHGLDVPPIAFGTSVVVAIALRVVGLLLFHRSSTSSVPRVQVTR